MFNQIINTIQSLGPWGIVLVACYIMKEVDPIIEAHLKTKKATRRNAHELSLMRKADRIVANLATVAEATPADRINQGTNELAEYANAHGFPVKQEQLQSFIVKAFSDYKANGGNIAKAVKDAAAGTVKDDLHV